LKKSEIDFCARVYLGLKDLILCKVDGPEHHTAVLSGELIGCLPQVDGNKVVFPPVLEKLLGHSEGGAQVIKRGWFPL
jgi:hypothetical protein